MSECSYYVILIKNDLFDVLDIAAQHGDTCGLPSVTSSVRKLLFRSFELSVKLDMICDPMAAFRAIREPYLLTSLACVMTVAHLVP